MHNIKDLPITPTGYRVLIKPIELQEQTQGGVFLPDDYLDKEEMAHMIGQVVETGPDAYGDEGRFPSGPWCQLNDWIVFAKYSGKTFEYEGVEYRLLNDDQVLAVVHGDPHQLKRAY